jgi:predicted phosphodiesterase
MIITKKAHNFHRYEFQNNSRNATFEFLLTSDWHFDNPKANRKLLFEHLDEAKKRNAKIIINGDMLCLMQGKYDPRKAKNAIRAEHNGNDYLDLVINDTALKMIPYAENILQINTGNHESSVSERAETNILMRLVERINTIAKTDIQLGAYMGYINLNFKRGTSSRVCNIAYDHGHWGGVVTKGALSVTRHASIFPNADVVMSGHTHDGWIMTHPRYVMNQNKGIVEIKKQYHIKTGTYKEEFDSGQGWAVEKIGMPKHLGSCWMKVYMNDDNLEYEFTLTR